MNLLDKAIAIASFAHADQLDKAGQPYILHPLRVMLRGVSEAERIVGVLHDVAEDCPDFPLDRLFHEGFGGEIHAALFGLTRQVGESWDFYIRRVTATSPLAVRVKIFDLEDNCDLHRFAAPMKADRDRVRLRYRPALARLRQVAA